MRDLRQLSAVDMTLDGERYRLRTEPQGHAHQALVAAGVRPPATVTHLGDADPPPPRSPRPKPWNVVPKSEPRLITHAS